MKIRNVIFLNYIIFKYFKNKIKTKINYKLKIGMREKMS